jgi:hypothetical protein
MEAAGFSELLVIIYQTTWCHIAEDSNLQFISHSLKCYTAGCVQVCCRGLMGSQMAGILVSVVVDPNSWTLHSTSCMPSYHQTSKAIQTLVLVGPVLLKLLHSAVAHCHLKPQICICILGIKSHGMMTTCMLDSSFCNILIKIISKNSYISHKAIVDTGCLQNNTILIMKFIIFGISDY